MNDFREQPPFNPANQVAKLVPTKPDREVAEELKAELMEAAKPWLEACAKAHKAGFIVQAQFAPNFLSQYIVQSLQLIKTY